MSSIEKHEKLGEVTYTSQDNGFDISEPVTSNEKNLDDIDIEKVGDSASFENDTDSVFEQDRHRLKQSLEQRHIQMIALVGVFGTGIYLSSAGALATAGPFGVLLAYALIGLIVGFNQMAMAEVGSLFPVASATIRHLEHFVDEAWGFGYGWLSVWAYLMPGEISSTAVIVSYWTDISPAVWISIVIVLIVISNSYSVRLYAEFEFFFALLKLALLVGLIIMSIVITAGGAPTHEKIGFRYWKEFGLFNSHYLNLEPVSSARFVGWWKCMTTVVYSYGGVQSVPTLAAEVKYPRRAIFTACKRIFFRVVILMLITIFFLTMIISPSNPKIASSTGTAKSSPFVIAASNANIKVVPHIINAVVLTSAFSVSNTALVGTSRMFFALAVKGQAPKIFLRTNKRGLPYVGMFVTVLFMPLAYMSISSGSASVFNWFQTLGSTNLLIGWIFISVNHIQLHRAMRAQGYSRSQLPHTIRFAEGGAWISGIGSLILLLTNGFVNFIHGHFTAATFVSNYITIPIVVGLTLFWKFYKKTVTKTPETIDLESLFKDAEDHPEPPFPPLKGWRILTLLWS